MLKNRRMLWLSLSLLIIIGGAIPVFHYWYYIGRLPGVTPLEARELLSTRTDAVLVDVRSLDKFNQLHIENAQNWPYAEIASLASGDNLPRQFQGKTLLLICDGGVSSAQATRILRGRYGADAYSVEGGMQAWIASAGKPDGIAVRLTGASGEPSPPPFKTSPWYEQFALAGAVLIIKPLYMLIALVLIVLMWRLKSPDGVAVRWGLVLFLAGETACGVNILFFSHSSYLLEFFHMYGMVLGFAFFTYGVFELLDIQNTRLQRPNQKMRHAGYMSSVSKVQHRVLRVKADVLFPDTGAYHPGFHPAHCGLQRLIVQHKDSRDVLQFISSCYLSIL